MIKQVKLDPSTKEPIRDIPKSDIPALLFSLPASHSLHIDNPLEKGNPRIGDAGLLVHLLAFFFGTRLQFWDWHFDGRVPIRRVTKFVHASDVTSNFVSHIYQQWKKLPDHLRTRYINILYMHGKVRSCEWEWDAFLYQYMVSDAIHKFYELSGNQKIRKHRDRLRSLCEHYGVPHEKDQLDTICTLRNDLFHEALWGGTTPGFQQGSSYLAVKWLERLNSRLIVAMLDYSNDYTKSGWWFFGWEHFGRPG